LTAEKLLVLLPTRQSNLVVVVVVLVQTELMVQQAREVMVALAFHQTSLARQYSELAVAVVAHLAVLELLALVVQEGEQMAVRGALIQAVLLPILVAVAVVLVQATVVVEVLV
jgi:hypothetical protein